MTARPRRLTAHFVSSVSTEKVSGEVFGDGRGGYGLSLLVKPMKDGRMSKSWTQRIRYTDESGVRRYRNIGLGAYPIVSLDMARQKALMNQQALAQSEISISPIVANLTAGAPVISSAPAISQSTPIFKDVAQLTLEIRKASWKEGSVTEKNWLSRLNKHIYPRIGDMEISTIRPEHIADWLIGLNTKSPSVGLNISNMLNTIFNQARARGYIQGNPMDVVRIGLENGARKPTNHSALPYGEARQAIDAFNAYDTSEANKDLFAFIMLTAVRRDEARLAKWGEVNWQDRVLVVPADRVKAKAAYQHIHIVPLSNQAFDILERRFSSAKRTGVNDYIFASEKGIPVAENASLKILKRAYGNYTIHGLRTTFSTWGQEQTEYPFEVLKSVIDHVSGTTADRAYLRSNVLNKQRSVVQEWADYIMS